MGLNDSFDNETAFFLSDYSDVEKVSMVCVLGLFILLAIPGNVIVIFVVARVQSMKTSTNLLLLNLCIADLLIAVAYLPFITVDMYIIQRGWVFGEFMCKLVSFSQSVANKASILILTALSLERYFNICRPNRIVITSKRVNILCMGLWSVAMGTASPLFAYKTVMFDYCTETWPFKAAAVYTYVVFTLFYVIPLLVMVALYLKIGQKLWQSTRRTSSMRHPGSMGKATLSSKTRLTKICVVIVLSFALSWAPAHIVTLQYYSTDGFSREYRDLHVIIFPIVIGIAYSNCALNPLLYCFMSQNFRNAMVSEWKRLTSKRRKKMYDGLPGMALRSRDQSILRTCTMSMRLQGSFRSGKEQSETDNHDTKHKTGLEIETSWIVFESAL